jgi:hypothetical protein
VYLFLFLGIGGCTTLPSTSCDQFDQIRRSTQYDTHYRYSDTDTRLAAKRFAPLRQSGPIDVRWYTLRTNRTQISTCDNLYLTKDLYLLRQKNAQGALVEQHEFYTADGKLITTKREDLTSQLKNTGYYSASVPLPIPKEAPAGTYRVVLKLVTKAPDGADRTLASASAEFRVLASVSASVRDENRSARGRRM